MTTDLLAGGLVTPDPDQDAVAALPDLPGLMGLAGLPGTLPPASPSLENPVADLSALPQTSMTVARPENPAEFGFVASLPVELAAGLTSLADLLDAYGLTLAELAALQAHPLFQAEYDRAMAIRKEPNGLVKLQAMLMLPKVLESQYLITQDKDMPPAVRVKAGENIMSIPADLYPKKTAETGPTAQSINIVFNAPPAGFTATVARGDKSTAQTYDSE